MAARGNEPGDTKARLLSAAREANGLARQYAAEAERVLQEYALNRNQEVAVTAAAASVAQVHATLALATELRALRALIEAAV